MLAAHLPEPLASAAAQILAVGEKRSRLQVVADAVRFLDPPKKAGDPDGGVATSVDKPAGRPAVGAYRRKAS